MKTIRLILSIALLLPLASFSQSWENLEESQSKNINGLEVSYITSYIKDKHGEDVYEVTATIANNGGDMIKLFPTAQDSFVELPNNSWAHFRFTNATGKGFSSREGYIYPNPINMSFPYKCNKDQKKPDYTSKVIGVGLDAGQSKTQGWRVRVSKGDKPEVKVLISN